MNALRLARLAGGSACLMTLGTVMYAAGTAQRDLLVAGAACLVYCVRGEIRLFGAPIWAQRACLFVALVLGLPCLLYSALHSHWRVALDASGAILFTLEAFWRLRRDERLQKGSE